MTTIEGAHLLGAHTVERVVGYGERDAVTFRARRDALAATLHPGVAVPLEVRHEPEGRVVATWAAVAGMDLAQILHVRGRLSIDECVWLGTSIALALAAMHKAGIAHGDVSPANIMVGQSVTLIDTLGSGTRRELGTPGYSAPERADGATAPADVFSLGSLLREAVDPADADRMGAWVEPMLHHDPSVRPTAAMCARALPACAPARPVDVPVMGVATAMRARAHPEVLPTVKKDASVWFRRRRAVMRLFTISAVTIAATFATAWLVQGTLLSSPATVQPAGQPPMPVPAWAAVSPSEGASALVEARWDALSSGNPDALTATTVEGSLARDDDAALAAALGDGSLRVEGAHADVVSSEVLSATGRTATVLVEYHVTSHTVTSAGVVEAVPPYSAQVEMDVVWSADTSWLAQRIRAVHEDVSDVFVRLP